MRIPLQASLRDASSPKGVPLGNTANFTAFRKAVPLGKVDASETSRRRGCIEVALVYANPSAKPSVCQLPSRGAFWVPSPRMRAPDIPQIIAYMLKLTSISCFSIVMLIYIDNLMIIGYLITIRRGLCMKEINSFG